MRVREGGTSAAAGTCRTPAAPEADSIGLVIERVREPGTLEKFQWYCPQCHALLHEAELQVTDIVADLPPVFAAFYDDPQARVCRRLRRPAPGKGWPVHDHEAEYATIDVHTHYVPHGWPDLRADAGPSAPWLRIESETEAMIMIRWRIRRISAPCWDTEGLVF
ncbi:hypothetical protein [Streptomyces sp. ST1020]|uniref:hypothetical protein n=1 Tax=Streptomyces sp. ST1020 TaxID=1848901 RepID=UPI0034C630DA